MKSKRILNPTTISLIPLILTISACEIGSNDLILFIVLVGVMASLAYGLFSERPVSCNACGTRLYLTGKKFGQIQGIENMKPDVESVEKQNPLTE